MSLKMPEPVAHIYPSTLEKFQTSETFDHCFSVKVGCPDETSVEVYTADALRDVLEQAAKLHWVEIMREGSLVTWGDAGTLGYRVLEKLREMKDSIK